MMEISESKSGALPSTKPTSLTTDCCTQECLEGKPEHKHMQRPSKPGKYVCSYCGRACAKPSVLQKHIRSHTGERPYPCEPCGFSFKTKSNLYKHCKSHTHREKAGGSVERETSISCSQEQLIELDEESQLASSSLLEKQKPIPKQCTTGKTSERLLEIIEDSQAVKKRLAMKLMGGRSRKASLLSFGSSRGSTESGYFSQSESFEVTPDSPNRTVATGFPEKIPEKSGCVCNVQLTARQYTTENKASRTLPPNKQVIDHITKLITINEAVVNTSKIDSVKPRRFSHHRRSRNDQKDGFSKESILHTPKESESSSKKLPVDGSPHKFHLHSVTMQQLSNLNPIASLETHPVSSDASEKAQLLGSQHRVQKRHHGMLRRQAAVEIPNDAETSDEQSQIYPTVPTTPESMPQEKEPLECFACGVHNWEMHGKHKKHICFIHKRQSKSPEQQNQGHKRVSSTHDDAFIFRKKRKEESLTLEDSLSSVPSLLPTGISTSFETSKNETSTQCSVSCLKEISVIHHTSSFEKLDGTPKAGGSEDASIGVGHSPYSESKHQAVTSSSHKIVQQHNVQMQGTVVANTKAMSVPSTSSVLQEKKMEGTCEFQWPQRSQSLSELPIEKLPPKKKRLCLSEAAQSSGDSSFESSFLPKSPIQGTHTSTRLTLFEERETDRDLPSNRSSRVVNYLTLSRNSHREMRRSASEKRFQVPQHVRLTQETRSKSFDLSRLSPERTASEWKRRSKGLTCRTMVDQLEEENELQKTFTSTYSTQRSIAPTSHSPSPTTFNRTPCLFNEKKIIQSFLIEDTPHKAYKSCEKTMANLNCPSGAARANYSSGSAVLRLEIPTEDSDQQDHLLVDITLNPELLRPLPALTIPVRLNSCEPLHAGSIYTVSRIYLKTPVVSSPQEHGCSDVDVGPVAMTTRLITTQPDYQSEERIPVGAESNSSFLSCINSKESVSESKLQSQVKEDEEGDQEIERGSNILKLCKKDEVPLVLNDFKKPPVSAFNTDLVFSWCYLNNVKPRPSIQGKDGSSVYSSWATSTSNPYSCGLTSKEMLALLICRQKHGTPTYTMANTSSKPMVAEKGSMTLS